MHHIFSACFETNTMWVLALRAHQSPSLRAEKHSPPFNLACTQRGPAVDGLLENLLRIKFMVLKNCTECFAHKCFPTEILPVKLARLTIRAYWSGGVIFCNKRPPTNRQNCEPLMYKKLWIQCVSCKYHELLMKWNYSFRQFVWFDKGFLIALFWTMVLVAFVKYPILPQLRSHAGGKYLYYSWQCY